MFTRFSAAHGLRTPPVAGTLVSLTTHAALVLAAVGGEVWDAAGVAAAAASAPGDGGEGVHWVGSGGDGARATPRRPGEPLPIAYVVPGHGPLREGSPGVRGPRRRSGHGDEPLPPAPRRPDAALELRLELPRLTLPAPPDIDAAILVAGVVAAAPDPSQRALRPDEFVRPVGVGLADELARADVRATDAMRALAHVDELPIALVSNPLPVYPAPLARSHVGGQVLVEFRIDSAGAVDLGSLRVVRSTNALFTQAVRGALPQMRFLPAQLGRHPVGVTVRQPFVFTVVARR
jgi:protein TonB